jgi:SAM-dependent methyltransferase
MAARGWDVEGVEVSSATRPITDFRVYTSEFSAAPIPPASFDAVTAWAVLEHVHDPRAYFEKAGAVLRPGGVFAFLVTNFQAVSSKRLFREDVPRHTYFFSEPVVRRYLAEAGLELMRADYGPAIFEMRPVNWLRYFLRHRLWGRTMTWDDLPESFEAYRARVATSRSRWSMLRHAATHSFTAVDRAVMPLYERATIRRRTYGIVTFVAHKPVRP